MSEAKLFATIKSMVADNELINAIELFENHTTEKQLLNELSLQKARFNEVKHQQLNDLISIEQANRERSKIRYALLGLIDKAQQKDNQKPLANRRSGFIALLAIVILLGGTMAYLFYKNKDKSSIKEPGADKQLTVADTIEQKTEEPASTLTPAGHSKKNSTNTKQPGPVNANNPPSRENLTAVDESDKPAAREKEVITYAKIKGRVLDQQDNAVKGVRVVVEGVEVRTDRFGRFSIALTSAQGTYSATDPLLLEYMLDSTYYESTDVFIGDDNLVLRIEK
jgi:hypothetical protein